jgi:chromosome segregation ATPase
MKNNTFLFLFIFGCIFSAAAQNKPESNTKNEVVVIDGHIVIRSVTTAKTLATKKTVTERIEAMKRSEAEIEGKLKQAGESIAELEKLLSVVKGKEEELKDSAPSKNAQPIKESETKNKVVENGKNIFVETTTINQVETSSAAIEKSLENLKKNRTELENQLKAVTSGKKELISVLFDIERLKK